MSIWTDLQEVDRHRPWVLDAALALGLLGASLLSATSRGASVPGLQVALVILAAAGFALRRWAPLPVLVVTGAIVVTMLGLGFGTAVIGSGLFLAAYTVAAHRPVLSTLAAAAFVVALLALVAVLLPERMPWDELATNLALFAGAFVLGRAARLHRRAAHLEAERAELAERARQEQARAVATEERLRIARELHDVVGHSLGVIALQAGVGARMIDRDPAEAKAALEAIAERSRDSLREVRQLLGALRNVPDRDAVSPGLGQASDLVAELGEAGLHVDLEQVGEPWPLTPAKDLTAYRVLQEALTNVVRHAGTDRARVTIRYSPDELELSVRDHGRGPAPGAAPAGGQRGMRERVTTWGGTLSVGAAEGGGYEVVARLPRAASA